MYFQVVFTGLLRDGFNRRRGIQYLYKQFALDFDQIKLLLSGTHRVVKRVKDRRQAERMVKALWNGGWHTELHLDDRILFRTNQAHQPDSPDSASELVRVYGRDSIVSADVPASWQPCSDLNPNAVLQAGDRNTHRYIIVLAQARADLPPELSLANYSTAQLQQCLNRLASARLLAGPSPAGQGPLPVCVAEISAQIEATSVQYLVAYLQSEHHFHALFLWCEQREFQQQKPLFQNVVASFRAQPVTQAAQKVAV